MKNENPVEVLKRYQTFSEIRAGDLEEFEGIKTAQKLR